MYFLTINAGSSSIKFSLFDSVSLTEEHSGTLSNIGLDSQLMTIKGAINTKIRVDAPDHRAAINIIKDWIAVSIGDDQIDAIGHRVVHGGSEFFSPTIITEEVISALRKIIPLDPEHLPVEIALIEQLGKDYANKLQVASFDTALFHELPAVSRILPLPRKLESDGIRRYGFHGLSYSYLLNEFERVAGQAAAHGKVIIAHLGNGVSLAAFSDGKPIDTSMSFTPAGGIPMSSRTGDIDPGIVTYLMEKYGMTPEIFRHMAGFESGLLGISETTSDMKKLLAIEHEDTRAHDAVEIFCYNVRKYIGGYAAALGGINSLIFSGGIGEVSAPIRARTCAGLEFLGITLDEVRNNGSEERISADGAAVGVHVLTTNEAATIAKDVQRLLGN